MEVQTALSPIDLIVDTREASKHKSLVAWLETQGFSISMHFLPAGDYVLNATPLKKRLCIERKTPMDLVSRILRERSTGETGGRLWEQLGLLSQVRDETTDVAIALIG